jgi:lambda family phage portal protein
MPVSGSEEFMWGRPQATAYDGAVTNYRLEQQGLISGESDVLAARELKLLWERSRHAVRNNGWATSSRNKYKQNLSSIKVKWKDSNNKPNKKMQGLWDTFAENPNLDGYGTLENTQDAWNGGLFDGEIFTRMIIKQRKGQTIPLVLQNISREYLDPTYTGNQDSNTRNGITFNSEGAPTIYNFTKRFVKTEFNSFDKVQVPADEILHIFIRQEVNQWRGIPILASILLPLYELDDLTDATVAKQKNAQAIGWIIKKTNPTAAMAVGSALTVIDPNDIDESTGKTRVISQTSGGGTQYLNSNEDIAFSKVDDIGTQLVDLIKFELHKIAASAGMSYTTLTGDLSGISFSALQQVAIDMKITAEYIYKLYTINLGLRPLCYKFRELAGIYVSKNLSTCIPVFQYPRRYSVNELKDAQADVLELQNKLTTFDKVLEERELTIEDIQEDLKRQEAAGISFEPKLPANGQPNNINSNSNSKG